MLSTAQSPEHFAYFHFISRPSQQLPPRWVRVSPKPGAVTSAKVPMVAVTWAKKLCHKSPGKYHDSIYVYHIIYIYTYVYIISYYSASYPPTPANARGSAPGNKTFGCLCTPCSISTAQQQEGHVWHSFSTVSDDMDDTLGSFWATFCRCSVLHCHCVSLSGRAAFAALAALGSSINSSQAPVHHGASAQHSSRKAMFDTVLLRF